MKCRTCGAENPADSTFCGDCGATLETLPVQSAIPSMHQASPVAAAPLPLFPLSAKTKRRLVIGAIAVAVVLIIGSTLGYLYYYQPVRGEGSVSATTIDAGQSVQFGYTPSQGISPYRYSWDFGDGSVSAERSPLHSYNTPGSYRSMVTVSDTAGKIATWTTSVQVNRLPSVTGTVSPSHGDQAFLASFTAEPQYGTPDYSYYWQFGDGNRSMENVQNPTHFYTTGNYSAVVVVTDSLGMTASWSTVIGVPAPSVTASVTPSVGVSSLNATFSAQGHGGTPSYTYFWVFGDGTTSGLQNPWHNYSLGYYTATVVITDGTGMTVSWSTNVSVNLPLTAGAEYWGTGYWAPNTFQEGFKCTPNQGVPPYSFYWDFGDGASSTLQNPVHNYSTIPHTATVTVTDSIGETATASLLVNH